MAYLDPVVEKTRGKSISRIRVYLWISIIVIILVFNYHRSLPSYDLSNYSNGLTIDFF
jgi:hypothetical protein